jgi:hypothetical protein
MLSARYDFKRERLANNGTAIAVSIICGEANLRR